MIWLTPEEVAARSRKSSRQVNRRAAEGRLHSHQEIPRGKRVIAEDVVDVWLQGGSESAQRQACGCLRVTTRRSA